MNPFVVQNLSSNKDHQFRNNPPMKYTPFVQNGCFSSVGRNNIQRCPYHTVGPYGVLPQNTKLPANQPLQYAPRHVALYSGLNVVNRNSPYPINVLSGKVKGLSGPPHQAQLVVAPTRKMLPPPTELKFQGKNFTKSPLGSCTNHTVLLDAFHKNFNLSRPEIHDVHDRKRKQIVPDDKVVVQNSRFLLNGNCNKRQRPTYKPQNETNRAVNNQNAMKENEDQVRYRTVIEEDKNGLIRVCYEPLLDSNESVSKTLVGGSNNSASLVDKDKEATDLDLTLHL